MTAGDDEEQRRLTPSSLGVDGSGPPRRSPRVRAAVGAVVLLALLGLGAAVVSSLLTPGGAMSVVGGEASVSASPGPGSGAEVDADAGPDAVAAPSSSAVVVHVLGSVRRPGIVEVGLGDRVIDAIAAAGGATDTADIARVNLARVLVDGEQLYVPAVGEELPASAGDAVGGPAAGAGVSAGAGEASGGLVNLNTADAAALETLPGVGPALASRILSWREENGPFRAVDELLAVSGIGEKTLAGFRDLVTV